MHDATQDDAVPLSDDRPEAAERVAPLAPLVETIWPFLAIIIVLVALALTDFLLVDPAPSARLTLLALRVVAGTALLILATLTLQRLFVERSKLQHALRASEERLFRSLSDIQQRKRMNRETNSG